MPRLCGRPRAFVDRDGGLPVSVGGGVRGRAHDARGARARRSTCPRLARGPSAAGRRVRRARRSSRRTDDVRTRRPRARGSRRRAPGARIRDRASRPAAPERRRPRSPDGLGMDRRCAVAHRADGACPSRRERARRPKTPPPGGRPSSFCGRVSARTAAGTSATRRVYDVDLRGYAQTTAMGLIALQHGDRTGSRARRSRFLRTQLAGSSPEGSRRRRRSSRSGSTESRTRVAPLHAALADDLATALVPRAAARGGVGGACDRPDALLDPLRSRA